MTVDAVARSILRMVGAGFTEEEALRMPLNKVFIYLDQITELERQRRKETVSDLVNSIGISLSGKGFEKYMKAIDGEEDGRR